MVDWAPFPIRSKCKRMRSKMVRTMSNSDSNAPGRPQLDPHAVWAQNQSGKGADRTSGGGASASAHGGSAESSFSESSMAEPQFAMHGDDDLPRTLRRERDARRQAQSLQQGGPSSAPSIPEDQTRSFVTDEPGEGPPVTVTAFDVPFMKMVTFYLKSVVAAIPALILLGLVMFAMGQIAQRFLPWLVKMRIMISFP